MPQILRPLSIGEILDKAFRIYRANFWLFTLIAAILLIPLLALELVGLLAFQDERIGRLIEGIFTANLLSGAVAWSASQIYLGYPTSVGEAYKMARGHFWPLLGAHFTQGLAYIPVLFLLLLGRQGGLAGILIVMIPVLLYVMFFSTRWGLIICAISIEHLNPSNGLRRSWSLTANDFWHVFGTLLTSGVLAYLMSRLPGILIEYASIEIESMRQIGPVLSLVITQLGTIISAPFSLIAQVVLYYDMRIRYEGYDLELALQGIDQE